MTELKRIVFRSSFWTIYLFILLVGYSLGLCAIFIKESGHPDIGGLLFALIGAAVGGALYTLVVVLYFTITLTSNGIRGYNFWGIYREVPWNEIKSTKTFYFGFLVYVRVFTKDHKSPLWVPLFMRNRIGFASALSDLSPLDCPLRNHFRHQDS